MSYEEIDLSTLSRRELQALCKDNGIPANKTNVFMVDALTKKRVPLSKMDSNKYQKSVTSIGKKNNASELSSNGPDRPKPAQIVASIGKKNIASEVKTSGPNQQKPVLFQNNFLRRGKRKDAPTVHESEDEEKPKVHSSSNAQRPHQMLSARAKTESDPMSEVLSGTAARQSKMDTKLSSLNRSETAVERADAITTIVAFPDGSALDGSINVAKEKIDDRVRSQIDAALCSKVMKPSPPEQQGDILQVKSGNCAILEVPLEPPEQQGDILQVKPGNCAILEVPLEPPEQQGDILQVKSGNCAILEVPLEPPEQQGDILEVKPGNGALLKVPLESPKHQVESFYLRQPFVCQIAPFPLSPLVRAEEKVRSVVERIQNFWKGGRDLAVVKTFGSPEEIAKE